MFYGSPKICIRSTSQHIMSMAEPLDENQGLSYLHGHVCEVALLTPPGYNTLLGKLFQSESEPLGSTQQSDSAAQIHSHTLCQMTLFCSTTTTKHKPLLMKIQRVFHAQFPPEKSRSPSMFPYHTLTSKAIHGVIFITNIE
jgi:hypothetical protein